VLTGHRLEIAHGANNRLSYLLHWPESELRFDALAVTICLPNYNADVRTFVRMRTRSIPMCMATGYLDEERAKQRR
jgi:hypothetical protein